MSLEEKIEKNLGIKNMGKVHSPGPWRRGTGGDESYVVADSSSSTDYICSVDKVRNREGNIDLIIAAPELLYHLEEGIHAMDDREIARRRWTEKAILLRDKARGIKTPPKTNDPLLESAGIFGRPPVVDVIKDCPNGHEVNGATELLREIFRAAGYYPKEGT